MAMAGIHSSVFISKLPSPIHRFTDSPSHFSSIPCSRVPIFHSCLAISQIGAVLHPLWGGLRRKGVCIRHQNGKNGKKRKWKGRAVYGSLFGVGAPEVLVIGVVALLVFGPRGLAEVARNLGKTIRSFQPTIRELQQVSKEFKTTLQKEIGLDEVLPPATDSFESKHPYKAENSQAQIERSSTSPTKTAYSSEDLLKLTEEQLKVVAAKQQITVGEQAEATPDTAAEEPPSDSQEK